MLQNFFFYNFLQLMSFIQMISVPPRSAHREIEMVFSQRQDYILQSDLNSCGIRKGLSLGPSCSPLFGYSSFPV